MLVACKSVRLLSSTWSRAADAFTVSVQVWVPLGAPWRKEMSVGSMQLTLELMFAAVPCRDC